MLLDNSQFPQNIEQACKAIKLFLFEADSLHIQQSKSNPHRSPAPTDTNFKIFQVENSVMTWEELHLPSGSLTREGKSPSVDNNSSDYKCAEFCHVKKLHFNKCQVPYMFSLLRTVHFENFIYLYDRLEQVSWWIHNYQMIKRSFLRHSESLNKYVAIFSIIIQTSFQNNIFKAISDTKI